MRPLGVLLAEIPFLSLCRVIVCLAQTVYRTRTHKNNNCPAESFGGAVRLLRIVTINYSITRTAFMHSPEFDASMASLICSKG